MSNDTIDDVLPNGEDDLRDAGCEDDECSGEGFACILYPESVGRDDEILCRIHFQDRQNSGAIEDARDVFTLDAE